MDKIVDTMNIKPSRTDQTQKSSLQGGKATEGSGQSESSGNNTVQADTLTLTKAADSIGKLQDTLNALPDINQDRVAEIKAAIADGSYEVDPDKIVENLLNLEQELL